jgi:hypothetical protein
MHHRFTLPCGDRPVELGRLSYDVFMEYPVIGDAFGAPRKITHDAARQEQRVYWSGKSIAERLAAMTELTERLYRMRGIDIDQRKTDFTPRRVRHRRS